jgi:hypothetical protein
VQVGSATFSNLTATTASLCNMSACNIDTVELDAKLVNAYSLVSTELSGASCGLLNVLSYYVGSQLITSSNLVAEIATISNVYSEYVKRTKITGSLNVFFNQLVDLRGHVVVNSNSKLSWSNQKDIPESDGGLSLFDIASAAYDGLQTISDLYDKLKGLTQDVPELPGEFLNPLKDA